VQAIFGSTDYADLHEAETLDHVREVGRLHNIAEQTLYQSFNGVFRDSCLNCWLFTSVQKARRINNDWREEYNDEQPHGATTRPAVPCGVC
jgi:hypothetical protein